MLVCVVSLYSYCTVLLESMSLCFAYSNYIAKYVALNQSHIIKIHNRLYKKIINAIFVGQIRRHSLPLCLICSGIVIQMEFTPYTSVCVNRPLGTERQLIHYGGCSGWRVVGGLTILKILLERDKSDIIDDRMSVCGHVYYILPLSKMWRDSIRTMTRSL